MPSDNSKFLVTALIEGILSFSSPFLKIYLCGYSSQNFKMIKFKVEDSHSQTLFEYDNDSVLLLWL